MIILTAEARSTREQRGRNDRQVQGYNAACSAEVEELRDLPILCGTILFIDLLLRRAESRPAKPRPANARPVGAEGAASCFCVFHLRSRRQH